jgi:hypothetical protein
VSWVEPELKTTTANADALDMRIGCVFVSYARRLAERGVLAALRPPGGPLSNDRRLRLAPDRGAAAPGVAPAAPERVR